ncbi:hypothetical protein AB0M44_25120 [Streptosporangium subroseum]|uniref:hypothetical protein n=1 Tax=Streptosporangium subroseum TaxID=106412 RepID=UPI00341D9E3C
MTNRSRVAQDPTQPNLRQVRLIQAELHDEVRPGGAIEVELPLPPHRRLDRV